MASVRAEVETRVHAHSSKKHKPKGHTIEIAAITIKIGPGSSAKITFKLNNAGKSLLRSHPHLIVKLTVTVRRAGQTPVVRTREIRINAPVKPIYKH